MKNSLLKFLLLLTGTLSILAFCPSYPTIPTTSIPKSDPLVLTSASKGMESVTAASSQYISISMITTLDEECPSGSEWNLLALTVTPSGSSEEKVARIYVECDTFDVRIEGTAFVNTQVATEIWTGSNRTLNIILNVNGNKNFAEMEIKSTDNFGGRFIWFETSPSYTFDETTKIYLCSDIDGAPSALSCTISHLELVPIVVDGFGRLGDLTPVTQAFYPLTDGKLSSEITSAPSGYFGDSASAPTDGTSPSWDSSNSFVKITSQNQFLTFPLVPLTSSDPLFVPTVTVSMWIRVTSVPSYYATLFSIYSDDDSELVTVWVAQDSLKLLVTVNGWGSMSRYTGITLDTWQLIHFNLTATPGSSTLDFDVFIGGSWMQSISTGSNDLSGLSLRIGDTSQSFIGDVSAVQMLSPGARFLTLTETCLSDVKIGYDSHALACSSSASLNPLDNKCYSSCPADVITPFTDAPFTLCLPEESETPSITVEESGGLSGGAIAGIVVGSVAAVATIAAVGYIVKIKAAKSLANKGSKKNFEKVRSPSSNMVSPVHEV